jgi:peptide/nickel transport system permease protein
MSMAIPAPVQWHSTFGRRLLKRPLAVACLTFLVVVGLVGVIAPIALPGIATQHAGNLLQVNQAPSWDHLLGTDQLGRDVLQRLLVGTRVTIVGVLEAVVVLVGIGVPVGLAAGYFGGSFDRAAMWVVDLAFSVPGIIIVILVLSLYPENMPAAMVTLGILLAPLIVRVTRSATLQVRDAPYIDAARVSGLSGAFIVSRHVLPRVSGAVIVQVSFLAAVALGAQSGLAFLNLLVPAPAPSWGGMVQDGTTELLVQPWLIWPPGMAIALTMLAFSLLGDVARDVSTELWAPASTPKWKARRVAPKTSAAAPRVDTSSLLSVQGLSVAFDSPAGDVLAVDDVSIDIDAGEVVGIVGESGCGKSLTLAAILGLLPGNGRIVGGGIDFDGRDLVHASERELCGVRGKQIALIAQDAIGDLDPCLRIGTQVEELIRRHTGSGRRQARQRALELLAEVQLTDPEQVSRSYPHQLSGGMAQRVAIARALAGKPRLLLADEPTTALDVTIQADILDLLRELSSKRGMAVLLVSHDWGVIADLCERVFVMYSGEVVEYATAIPIYSAPLHPYTKALLLADPRHSDQGQALNSIGGTVPQPGEWPVGCRFRARCGIAVSRCAEARVTLTELPGGRSARCVRLDEVTA